MLREQFAGFVNPAHDRVGEILGPEMLLHRFHQLLPKFIAASLMNPVVTDHGEFL